MFKALEVTGDINLGQFSRLLWQQRISHRIYREQEAQIVAVSNPDDINRVSALYRQWETGAITPSAQDASSIGDYFSTGGMLAAGLQAFFRYPVTLVLVIVCSVLALFVPLNELTDTVRLFLYPDFANGTRRIVLDTVLANFSFRQFLNMISPMLLHAGLLHLAFNMLWLWEFGRRIEARQASWALILLIMVLAIVSNMAQYLFSASIYFGGMSGVVYGLFAYIWMWQLFDPAKNLNLPVNLVIFMLLALVILTMIGLESIADTAHVAGLLCGVLYGATVATASRIQRAMRKSANRGNR